MSCLRKPLAGQEKDTQKEETTWFIPATEICICTLRSTPAPNKYHAASAKRPSKIEATSQSISEFTRARNLTFAVSQGAKERSPQLAIETITLEDTLVTEDTSVSLLDAQGHITEDISL